MSLTIMMKIPNGTDATSFYRGLGPLAELRRSNPGLNLVASADVNWATLKLCDILFLQRPYTEAHARMAQQAKDLGTPLWVDYDDYLFAVPEDNPAHRLYSQKGVQENIVECLRLADVVTVSTRELKRLFQLQKTKLNERVYVVPNAWDQRLLKTPKPPGENPIVAWRGSNTHDRDVYEFSQEIVNVATRAKDWSFTFLGHNPWFLTQALPKIRTFVVEPMEVMEYHRCLEELSPKILVVPLANHVFNRCKSNIAWIEATQAGAVVLAPEWEEWKLPGVTTYRNPKEFQEALLMLTKDWGEDDFAQAHQRSAEHLRENFTLQRTNTLRLKLLQALLESPSSAIWPAGGGPE